MFFKSGILAAPPGFGEKHYILVALGKNAQYVVVIQDYFGHFSDFFRPFFRYRAVFPNRTGKN
jgi:hypothetical protein